MMHEFLKNNRSVLLERCRMMTFKRNAESPAMADIKIVLPELLTQITELLRQHRTAETQNSTTGLPERGESKDTPIGRTAREAGRVLFGTGLKIEDIVVGYGDLCQAITELAVERDAPFKVQEFRILNLCIDTAVANAVMAYSAARDNARTNSGAQTQTDENRMLAHEMRNLIHTTLLAFTALQRGNLSAKGATGLLAERSLLRLGKLTDRMLRDSADPATVRYDDVIFSLAPLILEIEGAARVDATARGKSFSVTPVDALIKVRGDRDLLYEAIINLLQNAFKFTKEKSAVALRIYVNHDVFIEIHDQCGGLPCKNGESMFDPFVQFNADRSGLGLGLTIVRRNVETLRGTVEVKDIPGHGCVFIIRLPLVSHA
ncbi:sensor histidine kinase KdpD [Caballeronia sp. TF1N1]|uniref:sensor histidine kinase n=1 Tax=Caballeronia sp. TF1N1 TaxID=2878153 RepID=UPI001FD3619A|nr:HAMP domain-containing sensor histidine kinase [Caballeronia sp. TF1N1]